MKTLEKESNHLATRARPASLGPRQSTRRVAGLCRRQAPESKLLSRGIVRARGVRNMSALVEFPPELYDAKAFDGFKVLSDFRVENALALMWFSQLAYETGQDDTILLAQKLWHFDRISTFAK